MAEKIRLDTLVFEKGLASSLNKAAAFIMAGNITVDGKVITKPGFQVSPSDEILMKESKEFVSRGGVKLKKVLEKFSINVKDKICIDIGASTGGFTECLLKNGAKKVYCIDVGYGILDFKLRNNPKVVNIEKTNIRYFGKHELTRIIRHELTRIENLSESALYPSESYFPDLATVDVSFISLEKVLPRAKELVKQGGEIIALVKPQFEAPKGSAKKGVVSDEKIRNQAIEKIKNFSEEIGLKLLGDTASPIKGPKGNLEHFLYLKK